MDEENKTPPLVQVRAVAVSANAATFGSKVGKAGAKIIEQAMSNAVSWCYQEGITDQVKIKEAMMLARENAKREIMGSTSQGNSNVEST
jgi:hypothetical protein